MLSNLFSFNLENINISSIKESFLNFKEKEATPIVLKNYLFSLEMRTNMINWLTFLCNTLNFTNITLFRTVIIFDQYISKISEKEIKEMTQEKLNLITIASLSLSTKLEEVNCNYISFLNDKVLNSPNKKIFSNKDLTKKELIILKKLKFKILYSTPLDFINIYLNIFQNFHGKSGNFFSQDIISNIKLVSLNIMKDNISNVSYLINGSSDYAYLCFIQALNLISMNCMNSIFKFGNNNFLAFNNNFSRFFKILFCGN